MPPHISFLLKSFNYQYNQKPACTFLIEVSINENKKTVELYAYNCGGTVFDEELYSRMYFNNEYYGAIESLLKPHYNPCEANTSVQEIDAAIRAYAEKIRLGFLQIKQSGRPRKYKTTAEARAAASRAYRERERASKVERSISKPQV